MTDGLHSPGSVSRSKFSVTVALLLLLGAAVPTQSVQAQDYNLVSLLSVDTDLSQFGSPDLPSINASGQVAYARVVFDPVDFRNETAIFVDDGNGPVERVNLTEAGYPSVVTTLVVINDNGVIGAMVGVGAGEIIRVDSVGNITTLAVADSSGMADFGEIDPVISMNNAGEIAAKVTRNDRVPAIVLIDDTGITEIAVQSADLFSLSAPSVNDNGVVAFKAQEPPSGVQSIFTGTGGPITNEGANPGSGDPGFAPIINNNGLVLADSAFPLLYTASGGTTEVLVAGTESPFFQSFVRSTSSYGMNNLAEIVFSTGSNGGGLFTGNDPVNDRVLGDGDMIFGGPIIGPAIHLGLRSINDVGQLTFLVQTGDRAPNTPSPVVHVVLATPVVMADAGSDQTVAEGTASVLLDGSGSTGAVNFIWTQLTGPSVDLIPDNTVANPTFDAPFVTGDTTLTFELIVDDGAGAPDSDTVDIVVQDLATPAIDLSKQISVDGGVNLILAAWSWPTYSSTTWNSA